ncbi:MAG: type IV pilus twitching motility protein PilT [Bacillota bacterium]
MYMHSNYPVSMNALLTLAVERKASDVHLVPGGAPLVRVNREMVRLDYPDLRPEEVRALLLQIIQPNQVEMMERDLELDFSYSIEKVARFRGNVMFQRGSLALAMRIVPYQVPNLDDLGLPAHVKELCFLARGLVLVTGPTGSGKSTTLAAMIDLINRQRSMNIVTVEDPIEFLHSHKKSSVKQREVGIDTRSFANALRHVLRHDPDVILIGEMRDLDSISIALTAAETGHLVFSTLHTQTAPLTVHRIVDVFQEHQRNQIRQQLAASLQAVISQQLIPTVGGDGRVLAAEFLGANAAVRTMIREGKEHQLYSVMQTNQAGGMKTMDQALAALCLGGKITREEALERCIDKVELERLLQRQSFNYSPLN